MYKVKIATIVVFILAFATQFIALAIEGPLPIIQTFFTYLPLTMGLP